MEFATVDYAKLQRDIWKERFLETLHKSWNVKRIILAILNECLS